MKIARHGEIVLVCTPIHQATSIRIRCLRMEMGYRDVSYYYWIYRIDRWEFMWGNESRHPCEAIQQ